MPGGGLSGPLMAPSQIGAQYDNRSQHVPGCRGDKGEHAVAVHQREHVSVQRPLSALPVIGWAYAPRTYRSGRTNSRAAYPNHLNEPGSRGRDLSRHKSHLRVPSSLDKKGRRACFGRASSSESRIGEGPSWFALIDGDRGDRTGYRPPAAARPGRRFDVYGLPAEASSWVALGSRLRYGEIGA